MAIESGDVLGDRFEVLGGIGRGGTAMVYLVQDRVRNTRIALKVIHDHLSADAAVRARLQREVQAAGVLRSEVALVPFDLHEIDGRTALSMPYHPGQSLEERVAAAGALPLAEVQSVGLRVARALADAHRVGVLHRDVSASNVLLSAGGHDAVLTDFGLARLRPGSRSTGLLGTAGYAAPEVYGGDRGDPRSDLYGLGAALYLAVTGRPAFDARDPMAALRQQLDDAYTPIAELRPDAPPALAALIEGLLRQDPSERPQGAREVVDLLEQGEAPPLREPAGVGVRRQYLPPGEWTLVIHERDEDKSRRNRIRVQRRRAPATAEAQIQDWLHAGVTTFRKALGIPMTEGATPEEVLVGAVAEEAGLTEGALQTPSVLYDKRFRLVDRTDETTAHHLAEAARSTGFRAYPVQVGQPRQWQDWLATNFWVPIVVGWVCFPFASGLAGEIGLDSGLVAMLMIPTMILVSIGMPLWGSQRARRDPDAERLPVAFRASLKGALTDGEHAPPRFAVGLEADATAGGTPTEAPPPVSRGEELRVRTSATLDALAAIVDDAALGLPTVAQRDLRSTVSDLRSQADALAAEVDRLEGALVHRGAPEAEVALLRGRLDRLQTLDRAGETVDPDEIARLRRTVAEHEADVAAEVAVQTRLTASTAALLEIASAASKVRRQLLADGAGEGSAGAVVDRLRQEVTAADAARREAAVRHRAAQGVKH